MLSSIVHRCYGLNGYGVGIVHLRDDLESVFTHNAGKIVRGSVEVALVKH